MCSKSGFAPGAGEGGTAFFAHIGGFATGIVAGLLLGDRTRRDSPWSAPLES
jgi:membrane associated rhomboid family serine protease